MGSKSMESELVELFEKAKKAADKAAIDEGPVEAEEQRCLDALTLLASVPVTMAVLISSQVGKRLRNLTKHPRENIRSVAQDILEDWKKVVTSETMANNGNKASKSERSESIKVEKKPKIESESIKVEKKVKLESESIKVEKKVKVELESIKVEKKAKVEPEFVKVEKKLKVESESTSIKKASSSLNGPPKLTSMIKCNDVKRDKFRDILAEAFSKVYTEAEGEHLERVNACDPIRVAVSVESVMFEKLGRFDGAQKVKYRSIMFNLKDGSNPDLRRRVLLGEIKPDKLIVMTAEEMASDQRKLENKQIKDKALFECERGQNPKATTDQFKCSKCGQRKCTYYQLQTRSADEPMTTFVTCVNCNNHWKFC
ncbi:transcription elongation factor TFIIS [Cryptomeria japonica]|uniref:transcription elongation factor TFIIS n=1 Tax=Cryptomeria japonica TaxID=3369 RepID=UPI0027DA66AA|nr:transcription elongation factor TFIIS [Cryptomeria japonica]XP_057818118.2 transcription elongation factor TFIIS [Cryptomeria japonica]